jgi:divalent metal cation (Fe/Co/Zn/Cd) transporter
VAHELATRIEAGIAGRLEPEGRVITHLEPQSAEHREEDWEAR